MTGSPVRSWIACLVAALTVATATLHAADENIGAARELYASASYEDALALLNRMRSTARPVEEGRAIEQYRAFCLLALGRTGEAEEAIAAVVASEPLYQPSSQDVSPRVRSAFSDVRRRMLPNIIQQRYAQAKVAFDQGHFAVAAATFDEVLKALGDQDVAAAASQPPLSDFRTLAIGFYELAAKAAMPPPPVPAAPIAPPTPVVMPTVPDRRVYSAEDGNVVPPLAVKQELPPFPRGVALPRGTGAIEVVVSEDGEVESVVIRTPMSERYDALVIEAAKSWRYKPAALNGVPVKYKKFIQVLLKPLG